MKIHQKSINFDGPRQFVSNVQTYVFSYVNSQHRSLCAHQGLAFLRCGADGAQRKPGLATGCGNFAVKHADLVNISAK